jgi:hypothetical protein
MHPSSTEPAGRDKRAKGGASLADSLRVLFVCFCSVQLLVCFLLQCSFGFATIFSFMHQSSTEPAGRASAPRKECRLDSRSAFVLFFVL